MRLWDLVGYLAAALVLAAFYMREMVPLRVAALCSNVAFVAYGVGLDLAPVWLLHVLLLPMNGCRLLEALQARRRPVRKRSPVKLTPHLHSGTAGRLRANGAILRCGGGARYWPRAVANPSRGQDKARRYVLPGMFVNRNSDNEGCGHRPHQRPRRAGEEMTNNAKAIASVAPDRTLQLGLGFWDSKTPRSFEQVSGCLDFSPMGVSAILTAGTCMASEGEIIVFFDRFVEAFGTFDGKVVGRLFMAPGVALKRDGVLAGFSTQQDIEAYYQKALDHYRAAGCRACRYSDVETAFLNDKSVIATASWDLLQEGGTVISHWRQAYFLARFGSSWRIYGSAFVSE